MSQRALSILLMAGFPAITAAQSTKFNYTGSVQTYTVPPGVNQITIDAAGAAGGTDEGLSSGGNGARLVANLPVTPGETLSIVVGGVGASEVGAAGGGGGGLLCLSDPDSDRPADCSSRWWGCREF